MGIANELITRGWTQGKWDAPDGRTCLHGAVIHAYHPGVNQAKYEEACAALTTVLGTTGWLWWNDMHGRTFDEVLRVAKQADEILDGLA